MTSGPTAGGSWVASSPAAQVAGSGAGLEDHRLNGDRHAQVLACRGEQLDAVQPQVLRRPERVVLLAERDRQREMAVRVISWSNA